MILPRCCRSRRGVTCPHGKGGGGGMGPGGGAHDPPRCRRSRRGVARNAAVALPTLRVKRDASGKSVPGHRWCGVKPT
jgi:hypothetical protein